ncbi:MAG: hypothetical protein LBE02_03715 [Spirochaetaceae bacterium]|jgi:hypothetical protein|nr:hypothetical protein [Spirochaetaceae bacterium]
MKKKLLAGVLAFFVSTLSFGQIFRCTGELKNGVTPVSLHFVEYLQFRYLLLVGEVSIFLEEPHIDQLRMILEKFETWEALAREGQISLTKTIDSVKFSEFHYNHTFFKEPLTFYFIFTGGPADPDRADPAAADGVKTVPRAKYNLYVDTTLDAAAPFRLSRETVREVLQALSPEHLAESRAVYEQQRALENLFN